MALKILLADDEEGWRELGCFWLRGAGYEVRSIDNGLGVLAAAREFRPDGFVLDHDLGDTNGREVCKAIRSDLEFKTAKIVIMTAQAAVLPQVMASFPPDQFIAKTGQPDELLLVLQALLPQTGQR